MRQALLFGVPFLLPIGAYLLWFLRATRIATATGAAAPKLGDVPWPWLLAIGVLLLGAMLYAFATMSGGPIGEYQPPQVIDGRVVPGRIVH